MLDIVDCLEMKIKKTSVIVSKKNLPENLAPAKAEEAPAEEEKETAEAEETVEVEETVEAEDPKEDDLAHFEPLDGEGKFDLSDIFANDNEDEDDKDYGSAFNRLFDEAKDFDSDEKKEGDK